MKDNVVQVNLWDKNVGLLSWDDKRGCSVFQFDQDFMQYGWNIAPLVAPLDSVYVQRTFPMSGNREKLYAGLPEFIAILCLTIGEMWSSRNGWKPIICNPKW